MAIDAFNKTELWKHLRNGYATIVVRGTVFPDFPQRNKEPSEITILLNQQSPSKEYSIIADLLHRRHQILPVVPASCDPVGELIVDVSIQDHPQHTVRQIHLSMQFSLPQHLTLSESYDCQFQGDATMVMGANPQETHDRFSQTLAHLLQTGFTQFDQ